MNGMFPAVRMRRLRSPKLIRETMLSTDDLILPLFIDENIEGETKKPIDSMPGQYRFSIEGAVKEVLDARSLGIKSVLLFGIPARKDEMGSEAFNLEVISEDTADWRYEPSKMAKGEIMPEAEEIAKEITKTVEEKTLLEKAFTGKSFANRRMRLGQQLFGCVYD